MDEELYLVLDKSKLNDKQLKNMSIEQLQSATAETLGILSGKRYCISDLEFIVENTPCKLKTIIISHILTYEFCRDFILNNSSIDGNNLTNSYLLHYQPHLFDKLKK